MSELPEEMCDVPGEASKESADCYMPPLVLDVGAVRTFTLGSSASGSADANSQYYW